MKALKYDLTGQRFGKLVCITYVKEILMWVCKCDCGRTHNVMSANLRSGRVKSCGCTPRGGRPTKHGMCKTSEYRSWTGMRRRCLIPSDDAYRHYGARGISIDPRWDTFEQFIADMGLKPRGYEIDRIDNDGPYSPENCRWALKADNLRNKRNVRWLELNGERKPLSQWASTFGVTRQALHEYVKHHGWSAAADYYLNR